MILAKGQVAEIESRYETPDHDPPCTCERKDVDFYDTSGCESCDPRSEFNRAHSHAKYMLGLHGSQDIRALLRSHEELRRALPDGIAAILNAIDNLAAAQKKELNGNPLTDGRYQGMRKAAAIVREAIYRIASSPALSQQPKQEESPHEPTCAALREHHKPGYAHYETDAGEPCPIYHYARGKCDCVKSRAINPPTAEPKQAPALSSLIEQAREYVSRMSSEEQAASRRLQAISFAWGNVHLSNPDVTYAMVEQEYDRLLGGDGGSDNGSDC